MKSQQNPAWMVTLILLFCVSAIISGCMPGTGKTPESGTSREVQATSEADTSAVTSSAAPTSAPPAPDSQAGLPAGIDDVTITPLNASERGVETDSAFLLHTGGDISLVDLRSSLIVSEHSAGGGTSVPEISPGDGEGAFLLSFSEPLLPDSIYNIEYQPPDGRPVSFAFQTVRPFGVAASTPGGGAFGVPLNSGIEIEFTDELGVDFADCFTITPLETGRFTRVGRAHTFIPAQLSPSTQYTVTISGARGKSGEMMEGEHTFTFYTGMGEGEEEFSIRGERYETFLPGDEIIADLNVSSHFWENNFRVSIYDLETAENFLSFAPYGSPPENADPVLVMDTSLIAMGDGGYAGDYFIRMDNPLPEGYYMMDIRTDYAVREYRAVKMVQISRLSVYSLSINGRNCFWVNDAGAGGPAAGATVTQGRQSAVTDAEGLAVLETTEPGGQWVTVSYGKYPPHAYINNVYAENELKASQKYYSYMYTDRKYYKPDDVVSVFGVIQDRAQKNSPSAAFALKFGDMLEVPLSLDVYGSFTVQIPVTNMYGTSVELALTVSDQETLRTVNIGFLEYQKNSYVLSARTDKRAYFAGESARYALAAEAYDGVPVGGAQIACYWGSGEPVISSAGSDGIARGETVITASGYMQTGGAPYIENMQFLTVGQEDASQNVNHSLYVMPGEVMLKSERIPPTRPGSDNSVKFIARQIDSKALESYLAEGFRYAPEEVYTDGPADINFEMEIFQMTYEQILVGEQYDFISKRKIPRYEYNYEETSYSTVRGRTINGETVLDNLPIGSDSLVSYYGIARFTDSAGRQSELRVNWGAQPVLRDSENVYNFSLQRRDVDMEAYTNYMRMGETADIVLTGSSGSEAQLNAGRVLTIILNDKVFVTSTGEPKGVPLTFTEEMIPNVEVLGAYFDGRYVYPAQYPISIIYERDERELVITPEFDRDSYRPGEEVTASIAVTDKQGAPRKAMVNVSVVDEAVLERYGHEAVFISSFYSGAYFNCYGTGSSDTGGFYIYSSNGRADFMRESGGAERGGGGEDYAFRKEFIDNPAFTSLETDEAGKAELTFKLPDDITSWRVTVHSVTMDGWAGSTKTNIISTLPFYINLVMPDEFADGDELYALVKPAGAAYGFDGLEAEFSLELIDGAGKSIFSETKLGKNNMEFNMGIHPAGDYTVRVTAGIGGYGDAVELPVRVSAGGLELLLKYAGLLTEDSPELARLAVTASPVRVMLTNGETAPILDLLWSAGAGAENRTDTKAAIAYTEYMFHNESSQSRADGSEQEYINKFRRSIPEYHIYNGMPEIVYGTPDIFYTARFTGAFPELVNSAQTALYARNAAGLYENGRVAPPFDSAEREAERAAAYFTLAALRERVLLEIYNQIELIENDSDQAKFSEDYYEHVRVLYYSAALCVLGDDARAKALLDKYSAGQGAVSSSDGAEAARRAEYIAALRLWSETKLAPEKVLDYFSLKGSDNPSVQPRYVSYVCEIINFVKNYYVAGDAEAEVSYTLNGQDRTARLAGNDYVALELTREQYEELNLRRRDGEIGVYVSFTGGPENLDPALNKIKLTKTVSDNGINFLVEMQPYLPLGTYCIRDHIPGNMRFLDVRDTDIHLYAASLEDNVAEIIFYSDGESAAVETGYKALKVSGAAAEPGTAYVSEYFELDGIWGKSD
ncbi:MAG: hypothetical protein LBS62_06735 [Clostridiales bacterium]|jgi:hypothetical protein|nr:hypothetical protein [Clostridiales bacterium]